jgi:ketosteroid isomerase-like protein
MRKFMLFGAIVISITAFSQDARDQINKEVWSVFIDGYNSFNTEKFMSVYSKNVVRVPVDEKRIFNYTEYKKNIHRENQFNKNYNIKARIELRFIQRIHSADQAFEAGIYKISLTDNNGKPATLYSKFQVYLIKESGVWKIRYDTDSTENGTISEKEFLAAQAL